LKIEIGNWKRVGGDQRTDSSEQEAEGVGRRVENSDERALDEEVEGEEEEAQDEEEGAEGEAALREAADGVKKAGRDYAEARFGARKIKRPDGFVAGEIAAEGGELVLYPEAELFAVAPQKKGAQKKNAVAHASQQTESRTRAPIKHGTSPPAGRNRIF
jgi:hypothetical protein